ncbi:hypothetical protein [Candidatus Rhabdochlamydia sp. T3358]|uniref:hypothetical protein n=1 Tax=Candidatus Rhabdochlamydia sp. T3358 TaxID=2099795 RepID=UPI0010BA37C4|nr:hypothetical protein [Candidatus Rhabdochlamydia sp. T3358]VHN99648.1 hypothetical protein RHT_00090 [Candidatus Rhabdochlamydia sp. T3358]
MKIATFLEEFLIITQQGFICVLFIKTLLAAFFICGGTQMFDLKRKSSFFHLRRIVGLFLLIFGARLLLDVLVYS